MPLFISSYVRQKAKINLIIVACLFKRLSIAITRVIYSLALPGCPLPNQNAITSKKFAHIAVLHSFNLSPQFAVWGRRKILVRTGKADIKGWGFFVTVKSWIMVLRRGTECSPKRTEGEQSGDTWPSQSNRRIPDPTYQYFFVPASSRTRITLLWSEALDSQNVPSISIWMASCPIKYILKLVDVVSEHRWSNSRCPSGSFSVLKYSDILNQKTINMVGSTVHF